MHLKIKQLECMTEKSPSGQLPIGKQLADCRYPAHGNHPRTHRPCPRALGHGVRDQTSCYWLGEM